MPNNQSTSDDPESLLDAGFSTHVAAAFETGTLDSEDISAALSLLGDLASNLGGLLVRRRLLMTRLASLVDADHWFWSTHRTADDDALTVIGLLHSELPDETIRHYFESFQDQDNPPPENETIAKMSRGSVHRTRLREDFMTRDAWVNHPHVQRCRHPNDFDEFLVSIYPVTSAGLVSGIGLHRRVDRPAFTARDRDLVHMILGSVRDLHIEAVPSDTVSSQLVNGLTPRQRTVLGMLINGWNRKQIAEKLRLSPFTVADHMKAIYKQFDVKSHRALLQRFMTGEMHKGTAEGSHDGSDVDMRKTNTPGTPSDETDEVPGA